MEVLNGEVHFYWDMVKEKVWNLSKTLMNFKRKILGFFVHLQVGL